MARGACARCLEVGRRDHDQQGLSVCRGQLFGQKRTSRQRPTRRLVLWADLGSQRRPLEEPLGASYNPPNHKRRDEILRGASGGLLQPTLSCCRAERLQSINQQYPNYPKIFPSSAELSSSLQQIHFLGRQDSSLVVPNPTEPQAAQNEEFVRIQQETQPHSPAGSSRGCREEVSLEEAA